MITIASTSRISTAPARAFYDRWCDLDTHPQWAPSMASFRLDAPFAVGATGTSVTADGREARFTVVEAVDGRSYADATDLDGATLTVHHLAEPVEGGTRTTLTAWLDGPREQELAMEMTEIEQSLARDLATLAALLESELGG